jgi:Nucleotidyl transferase AbiEii toxin, Type IV TA system
MVSSKLPPFQQSVLDATFRREHALFLTGGAALAGYHLGHRTTDDLDLFTVSREDFELVKFVMHDVAHELGGELHIKIEAPGFCRYLLSANNDHLIIDTVLERVAQRIPEKPVTNGVRVDPAEEILANKLTAAVGRMEERDLVDLSFLLGRAPGHERPANHKEN